MRLSQILILATWIAIAIAIAASFQACSQEASNERLHPKPILQIPGDDLDTLDFWQMNEAQNRDLDTALARWYRENNFHKCAPYPRFKIDCDDCDAINVSMVVHVDWEGNISEYKHIDPFVDCRKHSKKEIAKLEACLKESAKNLRLTPSFAGTWLRIGFGLNPSC